MLCESESRGTMSYACFCILVSLVSLLAIGKADQLESQTLDDATLAKKEEHDSLNKIASPLLNLGVCIQQTSSFSFIPFPVIPCFLLSVSRPMATRWSTPLIKMGIVTF